MLGNFSRAKQFLGAFWASEETIVFLKTIDELLTRCIKALSREAWYSVRVFTSHWVARFRWLLGCIVICIADVLCETPMMREIAVWGVLAAEQILVQYFPIFVRSILESRSGRVGMRDVVRVERRNAFIRCFVFSRPLRMVALLWRLSQESWFFVLRMYFLCFQISQLVHHTSLFRFYADLNL